MSSSSFEGNWVFSTCYVGGFIFLSKDETTTDVIIMHMSFDNCAEVQVILGEYLFDSVDISLRIYDQGGFAIVGDISAIAESGCIEYDYI
jgi:hypothetical protein